MGTYPGACYRTMDTMKSTPFFQRRVAASSIVEVTTALVIISMVFSLAIIIYLNVQRSGSSFLKTDSIMMIEDVFAETTILKKYENKTVKFEDITVYQEVSSSDQPDLLIVRLEARDEQGKLIAEQNHLVYAPAQ